ncbi:hypothetical protein TI39_contig490g00009 [Zymoseptoria brevis]|uniref:Uncharacterized protein n=1 Tax=Zymoseptoria brevis TaxID=1047168 RepID=A0A0F4GK68_9PEZI|nr:hypothetical protein TI39_contig490g00009 [Zymoseptoria brevis]
MEKFFLYSLEPIFQYDGVPLTMAKGPGQDMNASITVRGTGEAIVQLQIAFQHDRLSFPDECYQTGAAAFDEALKYHMSKDTLPTEDEVAEIVSQQKEAGITVVTEEDFHIDRQNTRRRAVTPHIHADGFDIDFASMMLRVFTKGHGKGRIFDIGIVTLDAENTVYQKESGVVETWTTLQRNSSSAPANDTDFDLQDASSTSPALNTVPLAPLSSTSTAAPYPSASVKPLACRPHSSLHGTTPDSTTQAPISLPAAKLASDIFVQPDSSAGAGHTDEEILDGAMGPDKITGDVILRLGMKYSNKTLTRRINALYINAGKKARIDSAITHRLTNAFDERAALLKLRYPSGDLIPLKALKEQFDGYRFANKLRARKPNGLEYQDKGIKKADRVARPPTAYSRRKAKAARKKKEAQEDDVEDSEEDQVDEGAEEEVDNNGDEDLMDLS